MRRGTDNAMASRYEHDPRVARRSSGWLTVTRDGQTYHVVHTSALAWTICHDEPGCLSYVQLADGGLAIGIATADDAIGALLGDPAEEGQAR